MDPLNKRLETSRLLLLCNGGLSKAFPRDDNQKADVTFFLLLGVVTVHVTPRRTGTMSLPESLSRPTLRLPALLSSLLLLLLRPAPALGGSDYDFGAHPRFMCMPVPVDLDPSCFPMGGPSMGGGQGPVGRRTTAAAPQGRPPPVGGG